jgi:hypothetical protein
VKAERLRSLKKCMAGTKKWGRCAAPRDLDFDFGA